VDLLYHIAGKIKTVRDVSIPIPEGEGSDAEEVIPENESEEARKERITRKNNKRVALANSVRFTRLGRTDDRTYTLLVN
jgi:hypothetical protein